MPFLSPAVYVREHDLSQYATNVSTTIVAMVGGAQRGPTNVPTDITSPANFVSIFGNATPDFYGPYAALQFLAEGRTLIYERVAGESAFAAIYQLPTAEDTGIGSITGGAGGSGYTAATVQIDGDGTGAAAIANVSGGAVVSVTMTNPGVDYTTATITIVGDGTGATGWTANFGSTEDVPATITSEDGPYNVAAGTKTLVINQLDRSSGVLVVTARTITLAEGATQAASAVVSDITGTGGYSGWSFTAAVSGSAVLLTGKTNDSLHGIQIATATTFVGFTDNQPYYGTDVVAIPATIFGSVTTSVPIIVDVNDTLIINEYDRRSGVLIVTPREFPLVVGNPRTLIQIAKDINDTALSENWSVAADASGGSLVLTSAGVENELFGLWIDGDDPVSAAAANALGLDVTKAYYGSRAKWLFRASSPGEWGNRINVVVSSGSIAGTFALTISVDGVVQETYNNLSIDPLDANYVETKVNGVSPYITVDDNVDIGNSPALTSEDGANLVFGADGILDLSDNEFIGVLNGPDGTPTGLQAFANPETIDVNLVSVPGISSAPVLDAVIDLCETRTDCFGVLDPPLGLSYQQVIDWHNGAGAYQDHGAFNSSYAGLWWPWVQIFDPTNNIYVWTPPAGHVLRSMALTDRLAEPWFAPAGMTRGRIIPCQKLEHSPSMGERDLLYSGGNAVNPIVKLSDGHGGGTFVIWGQRTLQRQASALDRVNVRRGMLFIEKTIATSSRFMVFEQNDFVLWEQFRGIAEPFLASVKSRRGLKDSQVTCDASTNPDDAVDRNEMHATVAVKPTKTAEFIVLDFVVSRQGANFKEIVRF